MDILVGVSTTEMSDDALSLAVMLARLRSARLILGHVHPTGIDHPGLGHVDAEWTAFVADQAQRTLERARTTLARDWGFTDVVTHRYPHRSESHGLRALIEQTGAVMIVIGSSPDGETGHIALGATADALLHASPVPVAIAPEGYRTRAPAACGRVVVGFRHTPEAEAATQVALAAGERLELPVELLTVIVRATRILGSRLGRDPEEPIVAELVRQAHADQRPVLAAHPRISATVTTGDTVRHSLGSFAWHDDDVVVLGSSSSGPMHRVFLGDMTHKILRALTVPAVVIPRGYELPM